MVLPLAQRGEGGDGVQRLTVIEMTPEGRREHAFDAVRFVPLLPGLLVLIRESMPLDRSRPQRRPFARRCCRGSRRARWCSASRRARRVSRPRSKTARRVRRRRRSTVAPPPPAPEAAPKAPEADWRPQSYTVKRGDTLYQIALDHGLDYRELAAWNNLDNVNVIRVGQVLRLVGADGDRTEWFVCRRPDRAAPDAGRERRRARAAGALARARRAQHRELQDAAEGRQGALFRAGAARRPARPCPAPAAAPEPAAPPVVARVDPKPARKRRRRPRASSPPRPRPMPRTATTRSIGRGPPKGRSSPDSRKRRA